MFSEHVLRGVDITDSLLPTGSVILIAMINANNTHKSGLPLLVTAAVLFNEEGVLITRRPDHKSHPGSWEFPGGKIEPGESPEEALRREIREELDAEISVEEIFEVVFHRYDWGSVLILAYRCQLLSKEIFNLGVSEHRWVHPKDLSNFAILSADQPIIDRLCSLPFPLLLN